MLGLGTPCERIASSSTKGLQKWEMKQHKTQKPGPISWPTQQANQRPLRQLPSWAAGITHVTAVRLRSSDAT